MRERFPGPMTAATMGAAVIAVSATPTKNNATDFVGVEVDPLQ